MGADASLFQEEACYLLSRREKSMTYVQQALDGFDLPFPEIQQVVTSYSQAQTAELGAIFTRREVVDFMILRLRRRFCTPWPRLCESRRKPLLILKFACSPTR
jgi:hypothetical protein